MVMLLWQHWGEHVGRQLPHFLTSATLTDVTISVGPTSLRAHRIILAFFSPFFRRMLEDVNEDRPMIVVFPGANFEALQLIVAYMYHGQVNVPTELLPSVIHLAKMLEIKGLIELENYLHLATGKAKESTDQNSCTNTHTEGVLEGEMVMSELPSGDQITPHNTTTTTTQSEDVIGMQVEVTKIDESSEVKVDAEEDELVDPLQESLVSKVDVKDEPSDLMCVSLDPDCQPLPAPHHLPHTSLKRVTPSTTSTSINTPAKESQDLGPKMKRQKTKIESVWKIPKRESFKQESSEDETHPILLHHSKESSASHDMKTRGLPDCWSMEQYENFKKKYDGLIVHDQKLGCGHCARFGSGSLKMKGVHLSAEWARCRVVAAGKDKTIRQASLRKKMEAHFISKAHSVCVNCLRHCPQHAEYRDELD